MGDNLAVGVDDDVVGDVGEAELAQEGRVKLATVADGAPLDGVAGDTAAAVLRIGIEADAEDLELVLMAAVGALQAALLGGALVVPGGPDGDDIDGGVEVGGTDLTAVDIGGGEGGQAGALLEGGETLHLLDEGSDLLLLGGTGGGHELQQPDGLLIVGQGALDEEAADVIGGKGRRGVLLDELAEQTGDLRGRLARGVAAEVGHALVLTEALDGGLAEVAGIALDLDGGALGSEEGQFGIVGEHHDEEGGILDGDLETEVALDDGYGVEGKGAIDAVDVELAFVEALEVALSEKGVAVAATGGEGK